MTNSEVKRQKKLAKKKAKDKQRHKVIADRKAALSSGSGQMLAVSQGKILGAYRCDAHPTMQDNGIIPVLLVRQGPRGLVGLAMFLVDFWCLGVKDCLHKMDGPASMNDFIESIDERHGLTEIEPSSARAMVELAVGFADTLGLAPHADYRVSKLIWGDIPQGELPPDIEFGRNGKPYYFSGPFEDFHRQQEILNTLTNSVGPGNFDFVAVGSLADDQELSLE